MKYTEEQKIIQKRQGDERVEISNRTGLMTVEQIAENTKGYNFPIGFIVEKYAIYESKMNEVID